MAKDNNINNILKEIRKTIKPSKGPLTSIDPNKLTKAIEDIKSIKEVEKIIKNSEKEDR